MYDTFSLGNTSEILPLFWFRVWALGIQHKNSNTLFPEEFSSESRKDEAIE